MHAYRVMSRTTLTLLIVAAALCFGASLFVDTSNSVFFVSWIFSSVGIITALNATLAAMQSRTFGTKKFPTHLGKCYIAVGCIGFVGALMIAVVASSISGLSKVSLSISGSIIAGYFLGYAFACLVLVQVHGQDSWDGTNKVDNVDAEQGK